MAPLRDHLLYIDSYRETLKILLSETRWPKALMLDMRLYPVDLYQCSKYSPGVKYGLPKTSLAFFIVSCKEKNYKIFLSKN